jgi:hypothetical protein
MKIDKYKKFVENIRGDDDAYLNDMLDYNVRYNDYELSQSDEVDNLRYIITKMFKNSDIEDFEIEGGIDGLTIMVKFAKRETFDEVIKVFSLVNKVSNDILPQYDSYIDSWEDKSGSCIVCFDFEMGSGKGEYSSKEAIRF